MSSELHAFMTADHERLDALLAECVRSGDPQSYDEFRRGLLRHIAIEERVLFPLMRPEGVPTPLEQQLHRDHAALAALLVPPPGNVELQQIASILEAHNPLEEDAGGLYELIETRANVDVSTLMAKVRSVPHVRVMPNTDSPVVRHSIEQLVRQAEDGRRQFRK